MLSPHSEENLGSAPRMERLMFLYEAVGCFYVCEGFLPKTCKIRSSGESKLPLGVIVGVNGVCMCMYVPACPPQQWVCSLSWVYSCLFALWAPASARQTRVTLMCVKWVKRMTERADNAANVCWSGANMSLLHCAGSGRSGY